MLGQHFLGLEDPVDHAALRHHTLAFLEQVGQRAFKIDRHRMHGVGDLELHRNAVALDAAGFDQAPDAEHPGTRRFAGLDLGRCVEKYQIALESIHDQQRRSAKPGEDHGGEQQAFISWFH